MKPCFGYWRIDNTIRKRVNRLQNITAVYEERGHDKVSPLSEGFLNGKHYQATVPDTLDLVERADLAINAITGAIDEKLDYEFFWGVDFVPPHVFPHACQWFDANCRAAEALTLLRLMSGSTYNLEKEEKMLQSMLSRVGEDGLYYNAPYRPDAPWRNGGYEPSRPKAWRTDEDVSQLNGTAQMLILLTTRYLRDGDPALLERGRKCADALSDIAIYKDDYAYYPATSDVGIEFAYFRNSGWPDTKEATSDEDSIEGAVTAYIGCAVRALSQWHRLTKDTRALETARKLVNYMLKPHFWSGNIESWGGDDKSVWAIHGGGQVKPAALFKGHFAGMAYAFWGLIEYAIAANDVHVKEFVRQGYEYYRNLGLARIGMWGENIANNLAAVIAMKLCKAGVGDYWEDVDQYVRNAIVEDQFIDAEPLKKLCQERGVPVENGQFTIERLLGCLRAGGLIDHDGTLDPTQNGTVAVGPYLEPFYFIWDSIIHWKDETAQINLMLNRTSDWLDIDSYLPYEGKVVIKNKAAKNIALRACKWIDRNKLRCDVDGSAARFFWVGNYMMLTGLKGTEVVTVEFPMVQSTETYYLVGWNAKGKWHEKTDSLPKYVLHFKGNTCVQVEFKNRSKFAKGVNRPDCSDINGYPVYQREHYRRNKAPMKHTTRYIPPRLVNW